ncbi:hypothetical protein KP509_02G042900 [Ceratopteris richardii]|uniref:Protein kinase domain-containing protein n=1 Tax=Ceratopteris richardii TaxID=49495 RepID=A0A8T2V5A6_CERRI|nr:hypothetical protein KP509_02G042900 [Ceratopteris richardii]
MRACLSTSQTDGTEESLRRIVKAISTVKVAAIQDGSLLTDQIVSKIIRRKQGLQAVRKSEVQVSSHVESSLHEITKSPSTHIESDQLLFPLPLPPGYKPTNDPRKPPSTRSKSPIKSHFECSSKKVPVAEFNTICSIQRRRLECDGSRISCGTTINKNDNDFCSEFSFGRSSTDRLSGSIKFFVLTETCSPGSPTSFSTTLSDLRSTGSVSSSSGSSSVYVHSLSDLPAESLVDGNISEIDIDPPSAAIPSHMSAVNLNSASVKIPSVELRRFFKRTARVPSNKLFEGAGGPFLKVFLEEKKLNVAMTSMKTRLSAEDWTAELERYSELCHSNLSRIIRFSHHMSHLDMTESDDAQKHNIGYIMFNDIGDQSMKDFVEDLEKGFGWSVRLKIAIGIVDGLSYLLEAMPNHVAHTELTMDNVRLDSSLNVKLLDFVLPSSNTLLSKDRQRKKLIRSLGIMLLHIFGFADYCKDNQSINSLRQVVSRYNKTYPQEHSMTVIDLATKCLAANDSRCFPIAEVARVLHEFSPPPIKRNPNNRCKTLEEKQDQFVAPLQEPHLQGD